MSIETQLPLKEHNGILQATGFKPSPLLILGFINQMYGHVLNNAYKLNIQ